MERSQKRDLVMLTVVSSLVVLGLIASLPSIGEAVEKRKKAEQTCLDNGGKMVTQRSVIGMFGDPEPIDITSCVPPTTPLLRVTK